MSALTSGAQTIPEVLARIVKDSEGGCVTLTYRFSASGDVAVEDEGTVEVQGNLWHLKSKALEIYTDSASTWIIDVDDKEVIVEPAWSYDDLEKFHQSVMSKGAAMDIKILSETVSDKKPSSCFTPSFGSEWVVTDLR